MRKIVNKIKYMLSHVKIRMKLIIAGSVLVIIPIIIIGVIFSGRVSGVILELNENNMRNQIYLLSEDLNHSLKLVEDLSDLIYLNESLQRDLLYEYKDIGDSAIVYTNVIYPILRQNRVLHSSLINSISIYIENKRFLVNGEEIIYANNNIRSQDWYKNLFNSNGIGKKTWSDMPYVSNLGYKSYYTLYRQLNRYSGKLSGILQITLQDDYFLTKLADEQKEKKNYIINSYGTIVSSNSTDAIGKKANNYSNVFTNIKNDSGIYEFIDKNEKFKVVYRKLATSSNTNETWTIVSVVPESLLLVQINNARNIVLWLCGGIFIVLLAFITVLSKSITQRIEILAQGTKNVVDGNYTALVKVHGNDEISDLGENFNHMMQYLNTLINEVVQNQIQMQNYKIKQQETEFISLQNQINPHFLYNTLDAIRMHAVLTDNKIVAEMLVTLSNLLRYNITRGNEYISLKEEISHVKNYIKLMNIRYDDAINLVVNVDPIIEETKVLKLIMQPIVENSLKHGFKKNLTEITITLSAKIVNENLIIEIMDNGCGMDSKTLEELNNNLETGKIIDGTKSIGLVNVNSRLKMCFGDEYGIHITSTENVMTLIKINLPIDRIAKI